MTSPYETPPPTGPKASTRQLQLAFLALCAFLVNYNTLANGFVWDDYFQILGNERITSLRFIPDIFSKDVFNAENGQPCNYFRPVMYLVYMATYFAAGLNPLGFHLVNLLFHVGVTIGVFFLVSRLAPAQETSPPPFAGLLSAPFIAALLFALHPVHSEVVAWAACIPELSFTLFSLLALSCHIKSARAFDASHLASLAFFALGIFSKETAVTVLPILYLYDYCYRRAEAAPAVAVRRFAPHFAILAVYFGLRVNALGAVAPVSRHQDLSTLQLIINVPVLFMQYLGKLLLPVHLNAYYTFNPVRSLFEPASLAALAVSAAFAAACYLSFKKSRAVFLGLMLILLPLVPAFYIRGLGDFVFAERYLYFSTIGFALIAGSLLAKLATDQRLGKAALAGLLVLALTYSAASVSRNRVWRDDLSLWADTIEKSPDSPIPQQHIGISYYNNGDLANAEKYLAAASANKNASSKTLTALAGIYLLSNREDRSLELLQRVLKRSPDNPETLLMLANAYAGTGNQEMARSYHDKVAKLFPGFDQILQQRVMDLCREGERLMAANRLQEAEVRLREAYLMKSDFVPTLIDMGGLYGTRGDTDKAIRYFSKAAQLDPANPAPHYNLSQLYEMSGKAAEAKAELDTSKRLEAAAGKSGQPAR
jgi:Flp pilus assembly protein TadD